MNFPRTLSPSNALVLPPADHHDHDGDDDGDDDDDDDFKEDLLESISSEGLSPQLPLRVLGWGSLSQGGHHKRLQCHHHHHRHL